MLAFDALVPDVYDITSNDEEIDLTYAFRKYRTLYPYYTYRNGVFVIGYFKDGEWAVPDIDTTNNGVPDFVENCAIQLNATRYIFHTLFGFVDPLKSFRYTGLIDSIRCNIIGTHYQGIQVFTSGGVAYSGISAMADGNGRGIGTAIRNTLQYAEKNTTPVSSTRGGTVSPIPYSETLIHEYFHLIQYSTTYVRNGMILEGCARWAQDGIGRSNYLYDPSYNWQYQNCNDNVYNIREISALCTDPDEFKLLLVNDDFRAFVSSIKYTNAWYLFYPFAYILRDEETEIIPDSALENCKYIDGTPVFQDNKVYGINAIREFWELLHDKEDEIYNANGYSSWSLANQSNEMNLPYIYDAFIEILDRHGK